MRDKLAKLAILATALSLTATILSIAPSAASAFQYEHIYCQNYMAPDGTCPPNGSSQWAHLELNEGDAGGQSHETCIDEYLSNSGYTGAECMYYAGEEAQEFPGGEYGYPRAWNGGKVAHWVDATEYGYHTGAAPALLTPSLASLGSGASDLPPAVLEGLSQRPGLDLAAAKSAGGVYRAWVISSATETCLIHEAIGSGDVPGGVCGPTSLARERGLVVTTETDAGSSVVIGLAPPGNSSVSVTEAEGSTKSVPVTGGVYEIAGYDPVTVSLKAASGMTTSRHIAALSPPPASAPGEPPTP